jgi:peptidoglycan/LPS O-acetylase OafA/YrhL
MTTSETPLSSRHIPVLDGLRALAIIAVLFCHVNWAHGGPFTWGRINQPVAAIFGCGWVGVDLFFALSGFLITGILYDAKGGAGYFRNFYARRVLRIMPLYYGFLLLVLVILPPLAPSALRLPEITHSDELSLIFYVSNFRMAFTGANFGLFSRFWSLAVEEHFYLLWPIAVWSLDRRNLMRLCVTGAAASFGMRVAVVYGTGDLEAAFLLTPCRLDGLLAGGWLALARRDRADWAKVQRWAVPLLLGTGGFLFGVAAGQRHFIPDTAAGASGAVSGAVVTTLGIAALAIFFSALIALALDAVDGSWLRRALQHKGLMAIGKYSYGMYVFHGLILLARPLLLPLPSGIPPYVAKSIVLVWLLAVSFATAWLSYHLYEKHFLRMKRFFVYSPATPVITAHRRAV